MKILSIETSSMVASCAVADDEKILGEITFNYKKQHSVIIMPMIDRLLNSIELDINDVDGIACSSGPGSFTGLRIGAATAKGLCHGTGKPLIGVPTLDGLAFNMAYCGWVICPMMDALRDNVYTSIYRWEGDGLYRSEDYIAVSIDEILQKLYAMNQNIVLLGDGALLHKDKINQALSGKAFFAPPNMNMQRASSVAAVALKRLKSGDTDDFMTFAPFYLRKSQAEREYDKKKGVHACE